MVCNAALLGVSYRKLEFHLSDSPSYQAFTRLASGRSSGKSALQATIRRITPETLEQINQQMMLHWLAEQPLSLDSLRIDGTVVESNIADIHHVEANRQSNTQVRQEYEEPCVADLWIEEAQHY
jgi:hypothetical protein